MNKQELQNEIKKTQEYLANMEKMLAECEYERWKPTHCHESFFIVNDICEVTEGCLMDAFILNKYTSTYNCFQTREQAEQEAEKILIRRMLEDIARRLNKGKRIDWKEFGQTKIYLVYDFYQDKCDYCLESQVRTEGTVYCLNAKFLDVAIQEIGEERLKKYLRGE